MTEKLINDFSGLRTELEECMKPKIDQFRKGFQSIPGDITKLLKKIISEKDTYENCLGEKCFEEVSINNLTNFTINFGRSRRCLCK